jgi:hypothetical protein
MSSYQILHGMSTDQSRLGSCNSRCLVRITNVCIRFRTIAKKEIEYLEEALDLYDDAALTRQVADFSISFEDKALVSFNNQ